MERDIRHEKIAAKNLLTENSCYQCRFLDDEGGRCSLHLKDLPKELHCEDFSSSKPHSWWSKASLKDIEMSISLDTSTKEKLLKKITQTYQF